MKKYMTMLLALMMILLLGSSTFAQEYYTLPEIREQAAQGWHETYTDKYGRTIPVDIDVEVFGEETAPVLKVGFPPYVRYDVSENSPYGSDSAIAKAGGKREYIEQSYGKKIDLDRAYGCDYENDLTPRDAFEFLNELLAPLELSVDDFVYMCPEAFEVVSSIKKSNGKILSPALYSIDLLPQLHGLPIFTHAVFSTKQQGWPSYTPVLMFQMRNTNEYKLNLKILIEQEALVEDIPLCSLDQVIEDLEEQIVAGHIQQVEALRFGYALYNDPNFPKGKRSAYDADCYYAVPSWVVTCVFAPEPKKTMWDEEKVAKRIEEEGYSIAHVQRHMVINAQTGEMIDYFKGGKSDTNYSGFISWDDVK